jgi:HEAT repeat protein
MRKLVAFALVFLLAAACRKTPAPEAAGDPATEPKTEAAAPAEPTPEPKPKRPVKWADPKNCGGKSLDQWREELRSGSPARQRAAVAAVRAIGPAAADAVPDLIGSVRGPFDAGLEEAVRAVGPAAAPHCAAALTASAQVLNPTDYASPIRRTRQNAGFGLAALGPDAAGVLPQLLEALKHPDPLVRAHAMGGCEAIGPAAKAAVPQLTEGLKEKDPDYRLGAARALTKVDPDSEAAAIDTMLDVYAQFSGPGGENGGGGWSMYQERARFLLGELGERPVPFVVRRMKKPDGSPDNEMCLLLGSFRPTGEAAAQAAATLTELLKKTPPNKLFITLGGLGQLGPAAKAAVPEVMNLARSGPDNVRGDALLTAVVIGAAPGDVLPICAEMIKEVPPDPGSATPVMRGFDAVDRLGPAARELVPALSALQSSPNGHVRLRAAACLLAIDPSSADAGRVLLELAESKDGAADAARSGLRTLPAAVVAGLRPHLNHTDPKVRALAAAEVVARDPSDATAVKLVKEAVYQEVPNPNPNFRPRRFANPEAFDALKRAKAGGVPHLIDLLSHPQPPVRDAAARTLVEMGPAAAPAAASVAAAIPAGDDRVRYVLLTVLGRVGPAAKPHLNAVRDGLRGPHPLVRFAAADALADLDPADPAAAAVLADLLKPENVAKAGEGWFPLFPRAQGRPLAEPGAPAQPDFRTIVAARLIEIDPEQAIRAGAFDDPQGRPTPGKK